MMLVTANIFQPLIDVFESVLKAFHSTGLSWGWSIVLLTVAVRAVLVPLTFRQIKGMVRMQSLQPQMKAIQQKYKEDKPRQQQEIMSFYKENNVNPLASCLPMVLQLPVFISLYYMLRKNLRNYICKGVQVAYQHTYARAHKISFTAAGGQSTPCSGPGHEHVAGAGFLFIHDITAQATGVTLVILIILYVGSTMASSMLNMTPTMDKSQQRMMMFLPLIFVVFIIRFPAGLMLYWITTNLWTMTQQYTIKRMMGPVPVSTFVDPDAGDDDDGGGGLGALLRGVRRPRDGNDGAAASSSSKPVSRTPATPPRPPRKKKKRSGRRR